MSPPGAAPTPSRNLPANGETETTSARAFMREAARVAGDLGLTLNPAGIRVVVSRYLAEAPDMSLRSWFIAYADPTGETAVGNVMRGGPWVLRCLH